MKCLVTGACGFVGGHLCQHLLELGHDVVGTTFSEESASRIDCASRVLDIRSAEDCRNCLSEEKPDWIFHLAGIAFVPTVEKNFPLALQTNVNGVFNILAAVEELKLDSTFLLASSAEVYGKVTPDEVPLSESSPTRSDNHYALSKRMAELVVERFCGGKKSVRGVIFRPFNHIGPGQSDQFVVSSFARQLALIKLGKQEPVLKRGNLSAKRDFLDVRDVVRAYVSGIEKGEGIYNLASGESFSIEEMLNRLIAISGVSPQIEEDPERMRPSDMPILEGDASLAAAELEWKPKFTLEDSLRDVFDWWISCETSA